MTSSIVYLPILFRINAECVVEGKQNRIGTATSVGIALAHSHINSINAWRGG